MKKNTSLLLLLSALILPLSSCSKDDSMDDVSTDRNITRASYLNGTFVLDSTIKRLNFNKMSFSSYIKPKTFPIYGYSTYLFTGEIKSYGEFTVKVEQQAVFPEKGDSVTYVSQYTISDYDYNGPDRNNYSDCFYVQFCECDTIDGECYLGVSQAKYRIFIVSDDVFIFLGNYGGTASGYNPEDGSEGNERSVWVRQ